MQQTFNTWLLNLNPAGHSHPEILVLCSFCPSLPREENLENLQVLAVLISKQYRTCGAKLLQEEENPWVVQSHMLDNPLTAGTTCASIPLLFIYSNKQMLKTLYVSGPTWNLRGHQRRTDIGPAFSWSSHSFSLPYLCTPTHNLCTMWCQGTMGDHLWATETLFSTVIRSSYENLTLNRKKMHTYTQNTHQLFVMIIS